MPTLTVVAGPNGSGKSTLTAAMWFPGGPDLIDPDAIARRMNPTDPARMAISAGREAIQRCNSLLSAQSSFVLETTLAGNGALNILRRARAAGYQTRLVYVSLGDPELHIERVRLRVSQGGHNIPDTEVNRRYWRSLERAPKALQMADQAVLLDNSGLQPVRMLSLRGGRVVWRATVLPTWVAALTGQIVPS